MLQSREPGGRAGAEMLRTVYGQRLDRMDKAQGTVTNRLAQLLTCSHQARPVGEGPRVAGGDCALPAASATSREPWRQALAAWKAIRRPTGPGEVVGPCGIMIFRQRRWLERSACLKLQSFPGELSLATPPSY